jgi:hypothetical protein
MKSWYQLYARMVAASQFCRMVEQLAPAQAVSLGSVSAVRAFSTELELSPGLGERRAEPAVGPLAGDFCLLGWRTRAIDPSVWKHRDDANHPSAHPDCIGIIGTEMPMLIHFGWGFSASSKPFPWTVAGPARPS